MNLLLSIRSRSMFAILLTTIAAIFSIALMRITTASAADMSNQSNDPQVNQIWHLHQDVPKMARRGMAAVYDPHRTVVVMFGGEHLSRIFDETWEFDGSEWQKIFPRHKPPARFWHGMTYDSDRQVVVLYGGFDDRRTLNDTWEYDGSDWIQITTSVNPPPLSAFAMTYDSCRKKTVLYSGYANWGTWEYDGNNWERITVKDSPEFRHLASMTFDTARCKAVLFGGMGAGTRGRNDTWEYDGTNWTKIITDDLPDRRWAHALTYDSGLKKTILYGGYGQDYPRGDALDDTWEYDGLNWRVVNNTIMPPAREQHILVYFADLQKVLLFGGFGNGDSWFLRHFLEYLPLN